MAESLGTVELGIKVEQDQATRDLRRFATTAERAGSEAAAAFKGFDQRLGLASAAVNSLGAALGTLAVGEFLRQSVQAAIELETITRKLTNTLGEQGAAGALNFTRGLADDLGLSFKTLAQTFSSFTAAATAANVPIETQRDLFAAVSKAAQQLGLSDDELSGSLLALQQVASKGTVQMEELRGQLGERLPIAFAAAARGLGLTQQELIKLVESGKLTADQFFPALTKGLNELTASADGTPTAAQNIAKFQNAIDDLKTNIGQGLLPTISAAVSKLNEFIKLAASQEFARGLSLNPDQVSVGSKGMLTGLPEQTQKAVDAVKKLQEQFNLTDRQAQVLFYNASRSVGATNNAFGQLQFGAGQFEAVLKRLPALAKEFRDKYPDRQAQLQAENAAAVALLAQQAKSINSIDNLNARLKAQRDELNKVEIGSQRFQQLTQDIKSTEGQLKTATEAVKGTVSAFGQLQQVSTQGLDFRQQDIGLAQSRLDIVRQVAQAEQDVANARLGLEGALLNAQERRALKGVQDEQERQQIIEEFQRRREELEARQFAIREQSTKLELDQKIQSLRLEAQITELAAQRSVIQARMALAQATRTGDPNQIAAAQEGLQLAERELNIVRQMNNEKLAGQQRVNQLRLQQLELEKRAAMADNLDPLPPLPPPLAARSGIIEFKVDSAPINRNSQAVNDAAGQIGQSNEGLIQQISDNTAAVKNLAAKDWSVYAVLPDDPNPMPLLTP